MSLRPRHVHRVTPADVGERVSVRRWLDEQHTQAGDVLGELLSYEEGVLLIDSRKGHVNVLENRVLASRTVPPPPGKKE